jgi:hypothetical protein
VAVFFALLLFFSGIYSSFYNSHAMPTFLKVFIALYPFYPIRFLQHFRLALKWQIPKGEDPTNSVIGAGFGSVAGSVGGKVVDALSPVTNHDAPIPFPVVAAAVTPAIIAST